MLNIVKMAFYNSIKLSSGNCLPLITLGTFRIRSNDIYRVINDALAVGYRSFDTAAVYGNELAIGTAFNELLPKYNLTRQDIFLTTKLSPRDHGNYENVIRAVQRSLDQLKTNYLDLYLIHWPGVEGLHSRNNENAKLRLVTWQALVSLHKKGVLKSIGVSNYLERHLKEILDNECDVKPSVNQVEWHPHYHQDELWNFCKKNDIVLQAYSPLGSSSSRQLLEDSAVNKIAKRLGYSASQILLKWSVQQNIPVAVKASSKTHIEQNVKLDFILNESDMNILNNMSIKEKYAWNPEVVF